MEERKYDLVCCSHVLLHVPNKHITEFYNKMEQMAVKYILLIEPDINEYPKQDWAYYNFPYDYDKLFGPFKIERVEERVKAFIKKK